MAENRIQYTARNYNDFLTSIQNITQRYYPQMGENMSDASVAEWLMELLASIGDDLSFHTDRLFQETSIDSAQTTSSVMNIARTNGVKIPGRKSAIVEAELSCTIPVRGEDAQRLADERYAPIVKRGTLFSSGTQTFELEEDCNFAEQFDSNGQSNRTITPIRDSNGIITSYRYTKLMVVVACQSKIYSRQLTASDIKPFMTITLSDTSLLGVDSIIVKQGTNLTKDPDLGEFFVDRESYTDKNNLPCQRYFECESMIDQYRFGYETENVVDLANRKYYNPVWEDIVETVSYTEPDGTQQNIDVPVRRVVKGKWERFKNKFTTEYTDNYQIKITFGAGLRNAYGKIPDTAEKFTQYMMSRMTANDYLGVLPEPNSTMYILYRVGGGAASNIAAHTLTNIIFVDSTIDGNCDDSNNSAKAAAVRASFSVDNPTPSYGGRDELTQQEMKQIIKYNSSAQNRCITVHDYYARILQIPAKYGCPFRCSVVEENNKIVIYCLGLDYQGKLMKQLAEPVAENIKAYLSNYRAVNDFVEIRSGKIINISVDVDIFVDKTYDKADVVKNVIDKVYDYMDVTKHQMGEDIFIGDLEKEISKIDGVVNLIDFRVYSQTGTGYSDDAPQQPLLPADDCLANRLAEENININGNMLDLTQSDYTLYTEDNSMMEIKNKGTDITVRVKQR